MGIVTKYRIEEKYNHNILSVIFDSDSFFYGISDLNGHLMKATKYKFSGDAVDLIPEIIKEDKLAGHYYSSINVFSKSDKFAFIPASEYNYGMEEAVARNSFDVEGCDLSIDLCSEEQLNIIHAIPLTYSEALSALGSEIVIRHISLPYLQGIRKDGIYVHVGVTATRILVRKQEKFVYYNHFITSTDEDRLYFIMLALDQLRLSAKDDDVILSGINETVNSFRNLLANYIVHIKASQGGFANVEDSCDIMDLYYASLCE